MPNRERRKAPIYLLNLFTHQAIGEIEEEKPQNPPNPTSSPSLGSSPLRTSKMVYLTRFSRLRRRSKFRRPITLGVRERGRIWRWCWFATFAGGGDCDGGDLVGELRLAVVLEEGSDWDGAVTARVLGCA
ncbi:S-adenosyl-L-methionine-dependentmethyltransferases superfamily protein [Striga asiatica]|uniref:S-adenosyl-L-methionine-dependentmethyltransferases superfamily protein n=1 Tax=Striga asiatica TaxID=4170 RepID=A0A5A7P3M8_STRAF|nr:S-adenosyl-L-methionine-dependentmethyltransferases superfamily protein [Striga asiatica]